MRIGRIFFGIFTIAPPTEIDMAPSVEPSDMDMFVTLAKDVLWDLQQVLGP